MVRTRRGLEAALAALVLTAGPALPSRAEPERVTCRHWAVLLPEDAGQHRVYDGIRKGLELAQLERVCLKDVNDDEASFKDLVAWHATLAKPEPLLFAIGRRAGARLVAAGYAGPGVLTSVELTAGNTPLAPAPALGPRTVWVRAEVPAEVLGEAVRGLLGLPPNARPRAAVAWATDGKPPDGAMLRRFGDAAGLTLVAADARAPGAPQALFHVRLGAWGSRLVSYAEAQTLARTLRVPVVADDPAQFGSGATLLVLPDHQRQGRVVAEAGRRLWRNEPDALGKPLVVRSTEIWVDLVAAQAIGLEPPLTFLASADRVRAPPKRAASAPGAPGKPLPAPTPSTPR